MMITYNYYSNKHHLDALLLALASSTDNFTVGLSVGIRQASLPQWSNGCISFCNAAGAWIAGHGGLWFTRNIVLSSDKASSSSLTIDNLPLYLSSLAFGLLALSEFKGYRDEIYSMRPQDNKKDDNINDKDLASPSAAVTITTTKSMSRIWPVLRLAIPMTLNNLAGGMAGGAAGLTPELTAFYSFIASYVTMWAGYRVGYSVGEAMAKGNRQQNGKNETWHSSWLNPSLLSALLLGLLCLLTLHEAFSG